MTTENEAIKPEVNQVTTPLQDVKTTTNKRQSLTANFTSDEMQKIRPVIDARKEAGLTTTDDHFVRQCIDFSLNHQICFELEKPLFAVPNSYEVKPFDRKGFFNN